MDNYLTKHPYRSLIPGIIILLVAFGFLAAWRYSKMPHQKSQNTRLNQSLERTASNFTAAQHKLLRQSQNLAGQLKAELARESSPDQLYQTLVSYPQFWGTVLYQKKEPVVWDGFSLMAPGLLKKNEGKASNVGIVKDNNVIYWLAHVDFAMKGAQDSTIYHLFTAKRIRQHNVLSIGSSQNYSILEGSASEDLFNKTINIGKPLPDQFSGYRVLKTLSGDSVGVVVATAKGFGQVKSRWKHANRFWKNVFIVLCLLIFAVYLFVWVDTKRAWQALISQIIILGIVWFILHRIDIAQNWLPFLLNGMQDTLLSSYQELCDFFIDAVLFLCFAYTLKKKTKFFRFQYDENSFLSVIISALIVGLLNAAVVALTFKSCYQLVYHFQIPVLTLHIFPSTGTILLYFCIGILLLALTNIIRDLNRFLLNACGGHFKLVTLVNCITFVIGMLLLSFYDLGRPYSSWVFLISLIYFGIVYLLSTVSFRRLFSPLRTTAIYSFIIALAGAAVIYQATTHQLDGDLNKVTQEYMANKDEQAQALTQTLLKKLHSYYQSNQDSTVADRLSYLQAQIPTIVKSKIHQKNNFYFYDVQLRNDEDSVLLNFSNSLNAPRWMQQFSTDRLRIVTKIQNITAKGNRPIVQHPILENANKYQSFYRGWIALYSPDKLSPVAWILCSIYRNYPNFSKPLRSVINQKYYQYEQQSYLIGMYKNGQLQRKRFLGFPGRYPVYTVLKSGRQQTIANTDSVYYTSYKHNRAYRNLLTKLSDDRSIKVSTILPGYQNILFLYFQLSLILFVAGFILTVLVRWVENGGFSLFGTDDRFQYRILDSFLLAAIVFLILLVCITWVGTSHQNKELVKQQVFKKLTSLTTAVEESPVIGENLQTNDTDSFNLLASKLNVDALLYHKRLMVKSTTPQIYRQNLLPKVMPFPVYQDLYLHRARESYSVVKLNNQTMVLGYRSVQSASGKPAATVAIPTFIKSPLYNQQILRTTSYLIILYIIIFGIFILGTVFITRRLTKPLDHVQQGLREISQGKLNTTIPVTSSDEIGNLARVYNEMVERLRELRRELAETERENAWQEMAQQVAHEIKNPLTPMKLNVQYLERQLAGGEYSVQELTERITEVTQNLTVQIDSLSNIASDFSNFSQPLKQENFETVDINALIQAVADLYKHDSHIGIKVENSASDAVVSGVEDELHRVFVNLVKNAQEAIEDDGRVTFKTYNEDGSVFIEVDDNGQGIAEEDKSKIFVPNFSTKSSGTGLGLAICRKVIEAHGGSISFASIEGEGTTFVIKLPLANPG